MATGIVLGGTSAAAGESNMANTFQVMTSAPASGFGDRSIQEAQMNPRGAQITALGLPPKAEIVRLGRSYECCIATGSAFTHVAAWPTTRAELVIYNAATDGKTNLMLDSAWAANVTTSIAAASNYTLIGQLVSSSATAITDDTAQLITSLNGQAGANGSGNVKRAVANTSYAIANKWLVLGGSTTGGATATVGVSCFANLQGKFIVPPGAFFCLNLVVGTAVGTASIGVAWHEMVLA